MANYKVNPNPLLPSPQVMTSVGDVSQFLGNLVRQTKAELTTHASVINSSPELNGDTVDTNSVQTVSNKVLENATINTSELNAPVINSPTGIVKGDVGLGNVDNTSDANKPVSTATQTALNTKSNIIRTSYIVSSSGNLDDDWIGNLVFVGGTLSITIQPVSSVPMPSGTLQIDFLQFGAGTVQFVEGSGVLIVSKGNFKKLAGVGSTAVLVYNGSNVWYLAGDLA